VVHAVQVGLVVLVHDPLKNDPVEHVVLQALQEVWDPETS
jgi:hypothetical protein